MRGGRGGEHALLACELLLNLRSEHLVIPCDWLVGIERGTEVELHLILLRRELGLMVIKRCHGRILIRDVGDILCNDRVTMGCRTRENVREMRSTRVLRYAVWEGICGRLNRGRSHQIHVLRIYWHRAGYASGHCPDGHVVLIVTVAFAVFFFIHPGDRGQNLNL